MTIPPDAQQKILDVLSHAKGAEIDLAGPIYSVWNSTPSTDQASLLRFACETWGALESDMTVPVPSRFPKQRLDALRKESGPIVDKMLDALISRRLPEDEFYAQCHSIIENPFFADEDHRIFALYWILADKRIPYFRIGTGLHMSDPDYEAARRRLRLALQKIRFIVNIETDQKTVTASLVLDAIRNDSDGSERPLVDQVVLMAGLLDEGGGKRGVMKQLVKLLTSSRTGIGDLFE